MGEKKFKLGDAAKKSSEGGKRKLTEEEINNQMGLQVYLVLEKLANSMDIIANRLEDIQFNYDKQGLHEEWLTQVDIDEREKSYGDDDEDGKEVE